MKRKTMVTMLKIVTAGFLTLCAGGAGMAQTEADGGLFRLDNVRAITDGKIRCKAPKWSPDGKKIAFSSSKFAGIWVIDADGKNLKQLTDEGASGYKFALFKNSAKIAYKGRVYDWSTGRMTTREGLNVVNVNSGNKKTLYTSGDIFWPYTADDGSVWIRGRGDNKGVMFDNSGARFRGSKKEKVVFLNNERQLVYANMDGTESRVLSDKFVLDASLSPDGKKVLGQKYGEGENILVFDTGDFSIKELCRGYFASWSPDGKFILFHEIVENDWTTTHAELFVMRVDGTGKTQLTFTDKIVEMFSDWSPDGKKIAFCAEHSGEMYVADMVKLK